MEEDLQKLDEYLEQLNLYLKSPNSFAVGDHLTLADCCLASTISAVQIVHPSLNKYINILNWLERCKKELKGYAEFNEPGLRIIRMLAAKYL